MSTEKTIKIQTKKSLAGNWGNIIAAVILACVGLIALDSLGTLTAFLLNVYDSSGNFTNTADKNLLFNIIQTGEFVILILLSPIFNGIFKMVSNVSLYGKTEIGDAFFYFKNISRYLKSCVFNLTLSFIFILTSALTDIVFSFLEDEIGKSLQNMASFDIMSFIHIGIIVITIALKIIFYLIFIHYQIFTYAAFDNIPITKSMFGMYGFAFRHMGSAVKMAVSFTGWILLCFFVVPAFYVLPYMAVSMSNSAKWLFEYDKSRGLLC